MTTKLPKYITIRIETSFEVSDLVEFLENHESEITLQYLVEAAKQMLDVDRTDYLDSNAIEHSKVYDELGNMIYA
jgi:HD superfamily phosphohydrolase